MGIYLVILGGGLVKEQNGTFRTERPGDAGDAFGILFDRFRVEAGALLFKKNPKSTVIASGGAGQYRGRKDGYPTLASVLRKELIELAVPADSIIMEEKSGTTYGQLLESGNLIADGAQVSIISNEWHLPRIMVMLAHAPGLAFFKKFSVETVSAEQVLWSAGLYRKEIAQERSSYGMTKRVALEEKGVADIVSGRYDFKPQ